MKLDIKYFLNQGFNKSQSTSLAWCEVFEAKQVAVEYKYQGLVDGTIRISVWCSTYQTGGDFLPDTTRQFIMSHKGHKTRTIKLK